MDNKTNDFKQGIKDKVNELVTNFANHFVETKYDRNGNETKIANPMAIKSWFFKIFEDKFENNPIYNIDQMNMFFFAFQYIIEQVNLYIVPFAPDIKDFCRMINITNEELINYRDNMGKEMKTIVEKLYDFCRDGNLSLAQNKIFNSNITTLKAKSELEIREKKEPNVNLNVSTKVPLELINDRLKAIRNFETKAIEGTNE